MMNYVKLILLSLVGIASSKLVVNHPPTTLSEGPTQSGNYHKSVTLQVRKSMFSPSFGGSMPLVAEKSIADSTIAIVDVQPTGHKKYTNTINRVRVEVEYPFGGDSAYDTNNPEANPELGIHFQDSIGKSTTTEIDANGFVVAAESEHQEGPVQQVAEALGNQVGKMKSQEGDFPLSSIKTGDEWPLRVTLDGAQYINATSKLLGFDEFQNHRCAVIESKGYLSFTVAMLEDFALDTGDVGEYKCLTESKPRILNATFSSVRYWDNEANLTRGSTTKIEMTMIFDDMAGETVLLPTETHLVEITRNVPSLSTPTLRSTSHKP